MTLHVGWDPKHYDSIVDYIEQVHDTSQDKYEHEHFDQYGEHQHWTVTTNTIFSDTPTVDCGVNCAQLFVGSNSLVVDAYGLKTYIAFVFTNPEKRAILVSVDEDAQANQSNPIVMHQLNMFVGRNVGWRNSTQDWILLIMRTTWNCTISDALSHSSSTINSHWTQYRLVGDNAQRPL